MKWETYKLKQLCSEIVDCVNKTAPTSDVPTPYKMLRTSDIRDGKINLENLNCVTKEVYEKWTRRGKLQKGDVIFTREAPLGEVGLVREEKNYFLGQRLVLFRANNKMCDGRFLMYSLLWHDNKQAIISKGVGSTVAHLRVPECENIEIKVPDLDVQHRIADILSAYDDLIENNQKQIKLLEEAAQRLYKEWFVDLNFPGHENTKIVDGVPEGWSKSTVSEVSAVLRRGISPKYNEKARGIVINQKCIRQTIVSYDEARTQEKKYPAELEMMESDIVICSTGAGTLGRVGQIFEAKGNATLDSHVTLIRANEKIGQQSLFWSLKMKQDYLMNAGKGSTNQLELSRETIGSCEILIPERKIAEQVEKNFVAIHNKMKECSMQIARLREARDLLLPKLMSGEAEV